MIRHLAFIYRSKFRTLVGTFIAYVDDFILFYTGFSCFAYAGVQFRVSWGLYYVLLLRTLFTLSIKKKKKTRET